MDSRVLQFDNKCEELAPVKDKWVKYDEERRKKLIVAPQTPPENADLSSKIFSMRPDNMFKSFEFSLIFPLVLHSL